MQFTVLTETRHSTRWQKSRVKISGRDFNVEAAVADNLPVQLLLGTDVPQLFKLLGSEEPEMANIDDVLVVMTRDKAQQQLEERIQQKEKEIASGSKPHDSELVEVKANVDGRNWTKEGCRGSKLWTRTPSIRGGVENPPETERNFS